MTNHNNKKIPVYFGRDQISTVIRTERVGNIIAIGRVLPVSNPYVRADQLRQLVATAAT
jgi:hypothetical protein